MDTKLTGYEAIDYAEAHGVRLSKYADATEGARDGLDCEQAREIAAVDPGLVYCRMRAMDKLRLIVRSLDFHEEDYLVDLPSIEAVVEFYDLLQVYGYENVEDIYQAIHEGEAEAHKLADFIEKHALPWIAPTVGGRA